MAKEGQAYVKGWALVRAGAGGKEGPAKDVFDRVLRGIANNAEFKATTYYIKKVYAVKRIFDKGAAKDPFNVIIAVTAIDETALLNLFKQIAASLDQAGFSVEDGYEVISLLYDFNHP